MTAYSVDGDVYFSVDNFPNYGQLSGRKLNDNRAGERIAVDSRKRNPADFALWKAAKSGEVSWDSPWGPGRPGWHIECSAMSAHYLTHTFDIHGGGIDLIFPHHENEIAQNCAACRESKVSYWLHNGFVTENDEKMSKSLKNIFTIREVTELYHPLALRHFLLGTHYRSPVNYSISQIEISSNKVFSMYQTLKSCEDALSLHREGSQKEVSLPNGKTAPINPTAKEYLSKLREEFKSNMDDDLKTPPLLKDTLGDGFKLINSSLNLLKKKQKKQQLLSSIQSLVELVQGIKDVLDVLGLLPTSTYSEVLEQLKEKALKRANMTEEDITILIDERALARNNKRFSRGDEIRKELSYKGIALLDDVGKETTSWRPCVPVEHEAPAPASNFA